MFLVLYGISQNPDTKDYILIQNNLTRKSGNEKIDDFIQERQLKTNPVFEWIPYSQFDKIKETGKNGPITAKKYSARNDDFFALCGISQNPDTNEYILIQNNINRTSGDVKIDNLIQEIQLKTNKHDNTVLEWIPYNEFDQIEEAGGNHLMTVYSAIWSNGPLYYNNSYRCYIRDSKSRVILKCLHNSQNLIESVINKHLTSLYGISQNIYTKDYILVQKDLTDLYSVINEKIVDFIREIQLKTKSYMFKWIPYYQFEEMKKIDQNKSITVITVYSAIWKDDSGHSIREVVLKCLHDSQDLIEFVINEVKSYSIKEFVLNFMNHMSGNKEIDNFVQEMQLKTDDIVFEWIPYNKFYEIKEIYKNSLATIYSAIWRDGPLNEYYKYSYKRNSNKNVILKQLNNSQNLTQFVMNEVKKYPAISSSFLIIYGISQNSKSNDYILVQDKFINTKNSPTSNEKINKTIQEIQFEILKYDDLIFEWIPYNQFDRIKQIGKGGYSTVYSAIWKDGPLYLESQGEKYKRVSNKEIALKCLNNSQNLINELLKEVKAYSTKPTHSSILKVYGISQDPSTKNYIIVLHYAAGGRFDHWMSTNENYKHFNWKKRIQTLFYIASGLRELHDKQVVHRDFHTGNILFSNPFMKPHINNKIFISDMGLCGEVGNIDKTKIYGVTPYIAPEVLRGKAYTEAADIYSFGMIMYFVATERQPFDDRAHDERLVVNICDGVRPEINDQVAPRCYIDLMKKCWDSNPINRPDVMELYRSLSSISMNNLYKADIEKAENYRILHFSSPNDDRKVSIHPQAFYTSRLLNSSTENLLSYIDDKSECSDCAIINE
ncbi:kinase-like domain-containing protein [Rhizophagus clarus]|uniref:Kinase-like domain-containing protein n=1 Tax=Rhizophagus clarus TaxID=94130 RepID=A0A8H3QJF5_9GLOM|nr:kinase-like domain-containing protein [Rhizophagus clarus]